MKELHSLVFSLVDVDDRDRRSFPQECLSDTPPDSVRAASYDGVFVFKVHRDIIADFSKICKRVLKLCLFCDIMLCRDLTNFFEKETSMSNLGGYQIMSTLAKKVGGPLVLAAITAVGGYVVLRSSEAGVKKIVKNRRVKKMRKSNPRLNDKDNFINNLDTFSDPDDFEDAYNNLSKSDQLEVDGAIENFANNAVGSDDWER
jgi:hypothetical protein